MRETLAVFEKRSPHVPRCRRLKGAERFSVDRAFLPPGMPLRELQPIFAKLPFSDMVSIPQMLGAAL